MIKTRLMEPIPLKWVCLLVLAFCLLVTGNVFGQQGSTVTGTIYDGALNNPLPGANIVEKGTTNGTQTDFDGNYTLTLTTDNATLIVSYIGFSTLEVPVGGQTQVNATLQEDAQSLDEVVIVGYGAVKKSDLTGAIASVDSESLTERNFTNPLESVQGNIAGVQISNSTGRVGDGFDIQIRGQSSFLDSGSPLFVVDGAPVNDIDFLNPQDIAQIDILKDASSTAIYGSRGANGVVIVTTKSGATAKGGFNVNFDSFVGIKEVARLPELMDGPTWQYYHESAYFATIGGDPLDIDAAQLEGTVIGSANSVLRRRFDANQTFDWYDAVLRSAIQQNNYLNINGRSENGVAYNLGLGYQHETGNVLNEELDKYTLKTGLSHNVNDKFSFGANITVTQTINERGSSQAMRDAFRLNPFLSPYAVDDAGNETDELFEQPGKLVFPTSGDFAINKTSTYNPLLQIANSSDEIRRFNVVGNVFMQYNFLDWLSFKTTLSSGFDNRRRGRSWGAMTNEGISNDNQPLADLEKTNTFNYTWDNQIDITKTFNDDHNFKFLILQSIFSERIESSFESARNLSFESEFYNLGSGAQSTFQVNSAFLEETLSSYALRLNYDYKGKYFLTLSNRWDGYSLFSDGNKWDSFPSAAVAWRISSEDFIGDNSAISNLKLRASYGFTGNNAFDRDDFPYPTLNILNNQLFYDLDGAVSGFVPSALANSGLTWEKTKEWNVGLDFGLFNNRVNGSVDVYNRLSEDVIFGRELPVEVGVDGGILDNASSVRNKGIEAVLNTRIVDTDMVSWDVTMTYTNNTNTIESINGQTEIDDIGNGLFIGESIGVRGENGNRSNYNYVFDGIWQADERDEAASFGQTEGQAKVKDINGDGVIDPDDDRVILGSVDPDWTGSLFTRLRVGNFDVSASVIGTFGVFTRSPWLDNFTDTRDRGRQKADISWYVPENGAGLPAQFSNEYPQPRNQGQYWRNDEVGYYADVDFVKVKNIAVGYNFKNSVLDKFKLKGLRVYANVLNPFVFTDYMGYDPETASASLGVGRVATVTYQLGLNVKL
ncbi:MULTISPECIES: SusC/RagA family TonB-linked outer membrane protein [Flavobacteriaceae]|uniref:SusC/RagA family TonB-linked outer membrane protein n=1 Tax=Flavobacteriaceae TaxID=49546 RepID=UPI001FEA0A5C|nr:MULTISPECIES: SusC/RagA family TonB-linked outer membrane protein [Allomuricauda]MDC6365910.1 SusC/RagA family TonB-linked outer membrane protein [Muricauda sp. AC10]